MQLHPYQSEFVEACLSSWREYDRILGVAPTGSGKTVMAASLIDGMDGRALFLADAKELVWQAADKFGKWSPELGASVEIEMAESSANPGARVVVATAQSIARRLRKWPRNYFSHVIIDEAHRNTLGEFPSAILDHFRGSKVLGITATPFRSDSRELSDVYQDIAHEISLVRLIKEGFLSPITIKSVPVNVDLSGVRTSAGDYQSGDLGNAIDPHLEELAKTLYEHARDRKTVAFLPLIETSKKFAECCRKLGMKAVHVDGIDRSELRNDWKVVCNAQLLSTGWDEPSVDCVYNLRPTKSTTLFCQMVGRGTRVHPGKKDLLLLDPLWLHTAHSLVRPARLVARTEAEAKRMDGKQGDLLEIQSSAEEERMESLRKSLADVAKRKARTIDVLTLASFSAEFDLAEYEPAMRWEEDPVTEAQQKILERFGVDLDSVTCKGMASRVIDTLFKRRKNELATPKQLKWLNRFRYPNAHKATFAEASRFLDTKFGGGKKKAGVKTNEKHEKRN